MVRRLDGPATRFEDGLCQEPVGVGAIGRIVQTPQEVVDWERWRVDRVVRPRVTDFPVDVEVTGRADPFAGGLREERGRVEGRRRRLPVLAQLNVATVAESPPSPASATTAW